MSILPARWRFRVNILLLQIKRIGDLILTTPVIAALRQKFPEATLTLIVSNEGAAVLPAIAGVDRSFVIKRALSDLRIFRTVSREKFDYCIDFTQNDRSAVLSFLSSARKRIVANSKRVQSSIRARAYNELVPDRVYDLHTLDYHFSLIEPLGVSNASHELRLALPRAAYQAADSLLGKAKIDNSLVIFHPGSARAEKFWDAQRWAEVIEHARAVLKLQPVLTSGSSALEQNHVAEIKRKLSYPIVDLTGKIELLALTALIEQARLVVTVDSAPMHLAAAMKTPQVVLFGPTNPFHWRPRESTAVILQGRSTSPIVEFSPNQARHSMNDISTKAVIDAMNSLLSAPAAQVS